MPWEKEGSYSSDLVKLCGGESQDILQKKKKLAMFFPRTVENEESFLQYPVVAFSSNPLTKLEPTMIPEANLGNGTWCSSSSSLPLIRLVRKEAPCCFFFWDRVCCVSQGEKGFNCPECTGGGGEGSKILARETRVSRHWKGFGYLYPFPRVPLDLWFFP